MEKIKYEEKFLIGEAGFWRKWFSKFMFTLISVKVWGLVAGTWVSTYLLLIHEKVVVLENAQDGLFTTGINGAQWVTFNTTIWALIFGMKEIFRITEQKDKEEKEALDKKNETKKAIASMVAGGQAGKTATAFTPEGKEIVGDEPPENE